MTWPALLALLAAFAFSIAGVLLKRGLQYATPLTAALVSVTFTTGLVWLVAAVTTELSLLLTGKILPFLIAGLVAPGLARLAVFVGVDRIGVARAAPLTSLVVMWLFAGLEAGRGGRLRLERAGLGFLALSGLSEGLAYMTMWRALALGDVSIVSPLINAQSIFAVALAAIFLRDLERVTWPIAVAAGLIVAGVAVVVRFATG